MSRLQIIDPAPTVDIERVREHAAALRQQTFDVKNLLLTAAAAAEHYHEHEEQPPYEIVMTLKMIHTMVDDLAGQLEAGTPCKAVRS